MFTSINQSQFSNERNIHEFTRPINQSQYLNNSELTSPIDQSQFSNVDWNINNKSTSRVGKIFLALAVITLLGGIAMLTMHGTIAGQSLVGIGSDVLVFGGGLTLLSGILYICLKIRDWREKKALEKQWQEEEKEGYASRLLTNEKRGDTRIEQIYLVGLAKKKQCYFLEATKGADKVKIYKNR